MKLFTFECRSLVRRTAFYLLLTLVGALVGCSANRTLLSSGGLINDPAARIVPLDAFKRPSFDGVDCIRPPLYFRSAKWLTREVVVANYKER